MNKTIYIKPADNALWERLQLKFAGEGSSISAEIMELLRSVEAAEGQKVVERKEIHV